MLSAILSGKRRGSGLVHRSATDEGFDQSRAEGAEDLLTSAVFERLAYLPAEQVNDVFGHLLGRPMHWGALKQVQFWPRWALGNFQVEPDVVLRFEERTVLVEAKRWDGFQQQNAEQLARELRAGWCDPEQPLPLNCLLLAVGGHADESATAQSRMSEEVQQYLSDHDGDPSVVEEGRGQYEYVGCSWRRLFEAVKATLEISLCPGHLRLLSDIEDALLWHKLRTHAMSWMANLQSPFEPPATCPAELPTAAWRIKT